MPLGMSGRPSLMRLMTGSAMVFSSPWRPTEPSPQKRTTAPASTMHASNHKLQRRMRAVSESGWAGAWGSVTTNSAANSLRTSAIMKKDDASAKNVGTDVGQYAFSSRNRRMAVRNRILKSSSGDQ